MAIAQHPTANKKNSSAGYQGGLARSLIRTLLIFTFIPFTLMAGAAFLRSRTLLRDQIISQTQGLIKTQIQQMDQAVKTKDIRLDRIIRDPVVTGQIEIALKTAPQSPEFAALRSKLDQEVRALNPGEANATFNEFVLVDPNGSVLVASKPAWEALSLKDTAAYKIFSTGNDQSYLLYSPGSLYTNQMVLATIAPYVNSNGMHSAILVGFSDTQSLQAALQSMSNIFPSAASYFILPAAQLKTFIGVDQYTNQLNIFKPSTAQNASLSSTLDGLMGSNDPTPRALEFNSSNGQLVLAQAAWSDTMHTGIVLEIQQDKIFGALNSLIPFTLAIFLVSILAMGIVISTGARRVFRPLATLTDITRRFSEGDFSKRAEFQSKDEIGLLAQSFNQMADDLNSLYRSQEQKVEERTRQIRTAAEVAQRITSTTNIDEILNRTVQIIVEQFNFYQASIFMLDRGGKLAVLHGSYGPAAKEMLARGHRLEVGSPSIIGWVCANNQPRIASDVAEDPMHLVNDLLPETRSEVGIPISAGGLVLGALDVQSTQARAFGSETIAMLQTLASQIAVAIQNAGLAESTQINFQELERLYRASRQIAAAHSKEEALQTTARLLIDTPYPAVVLSVKDNHLEVAGLTDVNKPEILRIRTAVKDLDATWGEVQKLLSDGPVISEAAPSSFVGDRSDLLHQSLLSQFPRQLGYQSTAFLPILSGTSLVGLITISGPKQTLTNVLVQPYTNIADLLGITLDNILEAEIKERQLLEREALVSVKQAYEESLDMLYRGSHQIAAAHSKEDALRTTARLLIDTPYPALIVSVNGNRLEVASDPDINNPEAVKIRTAVKDLESAWSEVQKLLSNGLIISEVSSLNFVGDRTDLILPNTLSQFPKQLGYRSSAFIPIMRKQAIIGFITISGSKQTLTNALVQPYINIAELLEVTVNNILDSEDNERLLSEREALVSKEQAMAKSLQNLHSSSRQIAAAGSKDEALRTTARVLMDTPYPASVLSVIGNHLEIAVLPDVEQSSISRVRMAVKDLEYAWDEVQKLISNGPVISEAMPFNFVGDRSDFVLPSPLTQFPKQLGYQSTAFLPILCSNKIVGLITISGTGQTLTNSMLQPYTNIADLLGATLDKIFEAEFKEKQLSERDALASINQAVAESSKDLDLFFSQLHGQIRKIIGDYVFSVSLYDEAAQALSVPYRYEEGRTDKIEAVPLGEGLDSILIRTRKPLLLVEDFDKRIQELGVRTTGKPAKSWMGVPMVIQNKPVGAMVLQDLEHEHAFNNESLNFFMSLANQVAAVIHNAHLLEVSKSRAIQLETAAEIARDISGSLNLDELLAKAVNFIRERFNFYHASIFLIDPQGEFAIIREATGEAGIHMKRTAYKLEVGSKSIVGYVASRGESLIVNDTIKDATYFANPLLPNTRSEAALPLKVGERIVGIMDVQSEHPYEFTEDNLRTLQILTDQLAVAVENSELFAETQEHLSQHRLLHHITTSAASGTTLEEALESAVTGLQVTLGGDRVAIMLADREKKLLDVKAAVGYSEEIMHLRVPIGTGITGWAAAHRRALRIGNVTEDPRYIEGSSNTISELAVPLIYRNEVLGVLNVESEKNNAYTDNDEEMLGTLGGSLAAIIANARLLEQIRAQAERERTLYEITSKIRHSTDMQSILAITATELTKAVGARQTWVKITTNQADEADEDKEPLESEL